MRVEVATGIGPGAIAMGRKCPAGTAVGFAIVTNHRREGPFDQLSCLTMPASPRGERIGIDLTGLHKEARGNIEKRRALHRKALHEAATLAVETCRRPEGKALVDCPAP